MSWWPWSTPSPKLLPKPWRKIPTDTKAQYQNKIKDFSPKRRDVQHIRILLYGPTGAGKSSFINSVETALRGRMTSNALADAISHDSFTTKYTTCEIPKDCSKFYPFVFNDIMGLENDVMEKSNEDEKEKRKNRGVCVEDIKSAMKGHVKHGYKFNPEHPLQSGDNNYQHYPSVNDRTHVLVCVVTGSTANLLSNDFMKKMRDVRLAARDLGIPQMVILTKVDEACPAVSSDLRNVDKSKAVKIMMEKISTSLGIPLTCIFPVKNYHSEICTDDDIDKLILMALKQMIDFGEDFVNKQFLHEPWRTIPPNTRKELLQYVNSFQVKKEIVQHVRILLYGPTRAGKSSFINSVETTLRDRITAQALADGHDKFNTKYQTYRISKNEFGTFYPFAFTDIMSLEKEANRGVCLEDIKQAMKGHVKDTYLFRSQRPLEREDQNYQANPTMNDQTHVLVCVVPATADIQTADFMDKMKEVQLAARVLGIPQMAIVTKPDEEFPEVQSDLKNVYKSKSVKPQIEGLSTALDISVNSIFLVKNYCSEVCNDEDIDTFILIALKQMIDIGRDFVNRQCTVKPGTLHA